MDEENAAVEEITEELPEATPESAVLDEMGLGEEKSEATEPESKTEEVKEEVKPEAKAITDKDLEPLNSKNQATNERFQKLTDGYKQAKQEVEELKGKITVAEETFNALTALGFNDEGAVNDLVALSDYRKIIASGDAEAFQQSIANQIRNFESMHGKRIKINASALDNFPDLKAKVDGFEIDEDVAIELAKSRALESRQRQEFDARRSQQEQSANREAAINSSVAAVEAQQKAWSQTDPDYNAILPYLQPHIEEIGSKYPPEQWAGLIKLQYNAIKQAVANATQKTTVQPLRSNSIGGTRPAPKTPQDAVLQAMGLEIG